jgi:hypothetical protein
VASLMAWADAHLDDVDAARQAYDAQQARDVSRPFER